MKNLWTAAKLEPEKMMRTTDLSSLIVCQKEERDKASAFIGH
jgi:hypothetical protein